jgi:glycosyltransferase involved in cell wall biosynthesis
VRISLDVTAVPASPAGAGRYALELASALADVRDLGVLFVARRADGARWRGIAPDDTVAAVAPAARPLRLAWEQLALPGLLRRSHLDVHHSPHYTMPERARLPVVVTVHDTTFFDHPEWHERTKVALFRRAIRVAAQRAAVVVCVSDTTARHLSAVCEVAVPIVVAPHGVDHRRFAPRPPAPGADAAVLEGLGLDAARPFILYVGTVEPRKDVASLVRSFARVADVNPDVVLVVAGRPGWGGGPLEVALAETERHRARIVRLGYVPDDAVPALLRRAAVVAYPSLAEGYGLPALEALACGAPLVTTAGTAMAELAGDAAVLVPPADPDALAGALVSVLEAGRTDPAVKARIELGFSIAAARTWAASASRHFEAYRMALGA